jgi:hypothetical protein
LTTLVISTQGGLQSSIPPEFSALTNLLELQLHSLPAVTGALPPELQGKWTRV